MEALALDVRNYDAFKELIDGGMMTPEEGECAGCSWRDSGSH